MNIYYFLATLTGASTVIIWLGKFIITKTVDVGIEKYKAELVKDIEKHKAELSRITLEHQVMFSKLHEQRAEKIKLLHDKVINLEKSLTYSTIKNGQGGDFGSDIERDAKVRNLTAELSELIDAERIYFSDSTILKFDSLIKESNEISQKMENVRLNWREYNRLVKNVEPVPDEIIDEMRKWDAVEMRVKNEFKELQLELANEFRQLLGIKNN